MTVAHVRIGELDFWGGDLPSGGGFAISSLDGWKGSPGVRRDRVDRPGAHGAFAGKGFAADRAVTLRGRFWGGSVDEVLHQGDILAGLGGTGDRLRMTVQWGQALSVDVFVQRCRYDPAPGLNYADYQLELWMPDPFKYGSTASWTVASNVQSSMFHRGNTAAYPRFVVSGPQPTGYSITATGKPSFQVDAALAAGSTDVVDFRTGRVTRNGSLLLGGVSFPRTWSVAGGAVQAWSFAGTGSGSCRAELTDTFV